jgi:hypothetical protein
MSFSVALRAESIGAARFTKLVCVESLAGQVSDPSSPLDELPELELEEVPDELVPLDPPELVLPEDDPEL